MIRRAIGFALLACAIATSARAQDESAVGAAFRREGSELHAKCVDDKNPIGCAATFFTGEPLHISAGTIAPQNGVGLGPALVWHWTPSENWRWNGSTDAVWAYKGAWRAGAYATIVKTAVQAPTVAVGGSRRSGSGIHPYPVIKLYTQTTSLPEIAFYGIGQDTLRSDRTDFSMRETVSGGSVIWPITPDNDFDRLNLSVLGELNGRWVAIGNGPSADLVSQPAFVQFGEGVRIAPSTLGGHLRLNYSAKYQQYQAPSDSSSSFQRWTVDLRHDIPVYSSSLPSAKDTNTPNECAAGPSSSACPAPALSRNHTGGITLRAMASRSVVSSGAAVPFYFQPTIGGSDLDGNRVLASYDDYRFRGPHLVLFQETFEHSLFGTPLGLWLSADQGRVSRQDEGLRADDMVHSFAVGLSFRAGGLPVALLTFATGGPEGHHVAITVSPTLLGGSSRPSLQ